MIFVSCKNAQFPIICMKIELSSKRIVKILDLFLSLGFLLTSSLVNARIDFPYSGKFKLLHHPVKVLHKTIGLL